MKRYKFIANDAWMIDGTTVRQGDVITSDRDLSAYRAFVCLDEDDDVIGAPQEVAHPAAPAAPSALRNPRRALVGDLRAEITQITGGEVSDGTRRELVAALALWLLKSVDAIGHLIDLLPSGEDDEDADDEDDDDNTLDTPDAL